MSRINTNVNSMIAQRTLLQNQRNLNTSLERLSTGLQINSGKDNPAGLIASENLQSQEASINAATSNANRANQVMNTADGGLQQVNSLLLQIQGLVGQSANDAGLSTNEKQANQQQVDSILQTIDRIASTTSFQGTKLLNGTFDFSVSGQSAAVKNVQINGAKLAHGGHRAVQLVVTNSAQHGGLFLSTGGTALNLSSSSARMTFEVAGAVGSREFTFASGTTTSAMAAQMNTFTSVTGVSAISVNSGGTTGLELKSTGFGSSQFASVHIVDAAGQTGGIYQMSSTNENAVSTGTGKSYSTATNAIRDNGQNVGAIINGMAATASGTTAQINTDFLNVALTLNTSGAQHLQSLNAFTITGGGAQFNLGPNVDITNQVSIGIGNIAVRNLGSLADGYLNNLGSSQSANLVNGDLSKAQKIVNDAINQISTLRGRIGAFQKNVVGSTINTLGVALENTSAADSQIRDTNFAQATANMTRNQILVQASTSVLKMANSQPQQVLQLLQ